MNPLLDTVLHHLRQLEAQGQTHVRLDDSAIQLLRHLHQLRSQRAKTAPPSVVTRAVRAPTASHDAKPPAEPARVVPPELVIHGTDKLAKLQSLRQQTLKWPESHRLRTLRPTVIHGTGSPDAEIAFIYQAPSYHDEIKKNPLSGETGSKFDAIIKAMNTTRDQQYITPILKFRPNSPGQMTNTRNAQPDEISAFLPILAEEMRIIQPRAIIVLGAQAAQALLSQDQQFRGSWHQFENIPLRVTDHPSMLLSASNELKRRFWEDILEVMNHLDWPITELQQRFFLPKPS